jgi:hypothetical protein
MQLRQVVSVGWLGLVLSVVACFGSLTAAGAGANVADAGANVAAVGQFVDPTAPVAAVAPAPARAVDPGWRALRLAAEVQRELNARADTEAGRGFWGFLSQAFAVLSLVGGIIGGQYLSRRKG